MARSDHGFVEGELAGGKKLAALETDSEFNIKGKWQDVGGLLGSPKRVYCSLMFGFWDRMKNHRACSTFTTPTLAFSGWLSNAFSGLAIFPISIPTGSLHFARIVASFSIQHGLSKCLRHPLTLYL